MAEQILDLKPGADSAATDKVNDLKPVACSNRRAGPLRARDNDAIVFDGDTVALQPQSFDQRIEGRAYGQSRKLSLLSIDNEVHCDFRVSPRPRRIAGA